MNIPASIIMLSFFLEKNILAMMTALTNVFNILTIVAYAAAFVLFVHCINVAMDLADRVYKIYVLRKKVTSSE